MQLHEEKGARAGRDSHRAQSEPRHPVTEGGRREPGLEEVHTKLDRANLGMAVTSMDLGQD